MATISELYGIPKTTQAIVLSGEETLEFVESLALELDMLFIPHDVGVGFGWCLVSRKMKNIIDCCKKIE